MNDWQKTTVIVYGVLNFISFLKGFYECSKKRNSHGITPVLSVFGMFVWGDAVIFGIFWTLVSTTTLLLNDWILFLLILSVFWVVRSLGETIYWFNQQFSPIKRNPPEKLPFYKYFHNDSIWFIHQIVWQCITVVSIIFTIYLVKL
jgi:hypothetical protein